MDASRIEAKLDGVRETLVEMKVDSATIAAEQKAITEGMREQKERSDDHEARLRATEKSTGKLLAWSGAVALAVASLFSTLLKKLFG